MSRYEPSPALDALVARHVAAPAVDRAKQRVRDVARRLAPAAKTWVTMADERVRPTHEHTDGQIIPANLRYKVPKVLQADDGTSATGVSAQTELARVPRDEALSPANRFGCRCESLGVPEALRRSIHAGHTSIQGPRVRAQVYTGFDRAAESEYGNDLDQPARFMRGAIDEVAGRSSSEHGGV